MNRKNLFPTVLISLVSLLFSACSWFSKSSLDADENCCLVSFSVINFEEDSARALFHPKNLTASQVDEFILNAAMDLVPEGADTSKSEIVNLSFDTYDELTSLTKQLYIGNWTFTLEAYKDGKKIADGTETVDLDTSRLIHFDLQEPSTGDGSYSFTVNFPYNGAAKVKYKVDVFENLNSAAALTDISYTTVTLEGKDYSSVTINSSTDLPKGYYFLKLYFYSDAAATNLISQNTVYFQVSPGRKTAASVKLDEINTPYSIIYKNQDGTEFNHWNPSLWNGATPIAEFNSSMNVTLPVKKDVLWTNHKFLGWYTAADSTGTVTAGWTAGTTGSQTVYAKWEDVLDISDGPVSYTNDDITFEISSNTALPGETTEIAVTITLNKGTAQEKLLTAVDFANYTMKVYSNGKDVTSASNFEIDTENQKIKIQQIPIEQKFTLYISIKYNGKTYGGSFIIEVQLPDEPITNLSWTINGSTFTPTNDTAANATELKTKTYAWTKN